MEEKKFIVSVGISGSYKSYFGDSYLLGYEVVCPDDIRYNLYGDINDQEHNDAVWHEAYKLVSNYIHENKNVYLSSTALNPYKTIKPLIDILKEMKRSVQFFFFEDSLDLEACKNRIKLDIHNRKLRSNVPDEVVQRQWERYRNIISSERKEELRLKMIQHGIIIRIIEDMFPFNKFSLALG